MGTLTDRRAGTLIIFKTIISEISDGNKSGEGQWPSGRVDFSEPGGPGFDFLSRQPQAVAHQH